MGAGAALLGFLASAAVVNARTPAFESHRRASVSQEDWQGEAGIAGAVFAITTVIAFAVIIIIV